MESVMASGSPSNGSMHLAAGGSSHSSIHACRKDFPETSFGSLKKQ